MAGCPWRSKMLRLHRVWLVAFVTSLFFSCAARAFPYYKSPIDFSEDPYIRFGNSDYPQYQDYDMELEIDHSSVSHSWVNMTLHLWGPMVEQRDISHFLIIANGKVIEEFRPQYVENSDGEWVFPHIYYLKPSVSNFIGAPIWFQVVAVQRDSSGNQYAVAWTGKSEEIQMDDLPVKDKEAISILYAILEKLKEILAKLEQMIPLLEAMKNLLEKISKQIETLFTPSPAAAERLEEATKELLEKTPMDDLLDNSKRMEDMFENTPTNPPLSELTFGEKRDWFGTGRSHYLIDLTEFREVLSLMRQVMDAAVWVLFFLFLLRFLQPKLNI